MDWKIKIGKNRSKNRRKIAENFLKIGILLEEKFKKSADFLTLYRYPYAQKVRRFFSFPRVYKRIMKKVRACAKRENPVKTSIKIGVKLHLKYSKIGILLEEKFKKSADFLTLYRYPIVENLRRFFILI